MLSRLPLIALLVVLVLGNLVHAAEQGEASAKVRILGVGNSFTQNVANYLPQVINADKEIAAEIALAYRGGSTMEFHVTEAQKHEQDPREGMAYRYRVGGAYVTGEDGKLKMHALKEILLDGKWDYITIQQGSPKTPFKESFYPYARELYDYIKKYAPDATIVVHETWPYRVDSPRLVRWKMTPQQMYERLHENYTQVAKELGVGLIPVGTAFNLAMQEEMWNFQLPEGFDRSKMKYPEDEKNLPDESRSLQSGFTWRDDKKNPGNKTLEVDAHHANGNGSFLGALVWYRYFFKKDPRELNYKPGFMSQEQADSLKMIAYKAFEENGH